MHLALLTGVCPGVCFSLLCLVHAQSLGRVRLFAALWAAAHRLLCPWNFPGKNTGVGSHFLLQGIFLTQEANLNLVLNPNLKVTGGFFTTLPPGKLSCTPNLNIVSNLCAVKKCSSAWRGWKMSALFPAPPDWPVLHQAGRPSPLSRPRFPHLWNMDWPAGTCQVCLFQNHLGLMQFPRPLPWTRGGRKLESVSLNQVSQ